MRDLMMRVLVASLSVLAGGMSTGGCAKTLEKVEAYSDPHDDTKLSDCRAVGMANREAGSSKADAFKAYVQCRCEAGLCADGGAK